MKIGKISVQIMIFFFVGLLAAPVSYGIDAVASLGKLKGNVEVLRKIGARKESRKIPGRTGLILNDKDIVVTGSSSKATIIFRDGSEIRLFQKTRFVIEKSTESKQGSRRFFHNFRLTIGSFWGKFIKGRQRTKIKTPTATIGIKGTNVAFTERNGELDIALSSGLISVSNLDDEILLKPGKQIKALNREGAISEKISDLPYRVLITPDENHIDIPRSGKTGEIYFTIQIIDNATKKNVSRSGNVYISLELDKIVFDSEVQLNNRGYARIRAKILPFTRADFQNGQVHIFAVMDGAEFMDVGAGQTVLTYDIPNKAQKTIRLDVNSGQFSQ